MERKRIFYLDFVRAFATVAILLTHYNAMFIYAQPQLLEKSVITSYVSNIYIGSFGVALFLVISGAALMHVYSEKLDTKSFYKKRVVKIFPMFWMAYAAAFIIRYYRVGSVSPGTPKTNLIWSVLGMDAYVTTYAGIPTFYIVGEWFLGFIILFYLIFPLLRKLMVVSPVLFGVVTAGIYGVSWVFPYGYASVSLMRLLPLLAFGMYFVRFIKKAAWQMAVPSLVVLIANQILKPRGIHQDIQQLYVGVAAFLVLAFLADFLTWNPFRKACSWICKYSYPIFIIHHTIITLIMSRVDIYSMSVKKSYMMFGVCCLMILPAAYFLQLFHDKVMGLTRRNK